MAEAEPTRASGGLQALNSGSGLYKLVKLGHVEATYAPTDIEVAHIEAQFIGPDLRDAEKELLQIAGSEETERKALLDRCAQYDAILDHLNAKTGDAKPAKDTSDVHTTSTHGMDFAQQTASGFDAPDSATRLPAPLIRADVAAFPHDGLDFVGEDDEEDLLCDFAPSAMQSDGGFGLVSADGCVSLPVSPSGKAGGAGGFLASHASLSMEDSMTYRPPATGEPCLSDSWHAGDFAPRSGGFADASITSLRHRYRRVFGKETSSNNRQWLLRRLAEISEYDARLGDGSDEYDGGDDSGDFRSGDGSDDAGDSSPFTDGSGSAGTHTDFFGAGDSAAHTAHGRRASFSKHDGAGRGAMRHANAAAGRKGKRGSSDSHSAEGGAAKTDASAASKKRKGGHHSDSDGESPVKSSRGADPRGRGNARGHSGKGSPRGRDGVGANGRRSKHHNPWALEEAEALVDGVARCGGGKWADIKKLGFPAIEHRTAVDLKDKWRNLLRIAMLPHQPAKSAGDKKREIPAELLARVRDLAAKQAKKAAADGRSRAGGR